MLKMLLAIFCSLLFFTSCDVVPKLSSISQIATTFDSGSSNFNGGFIILGIRSDVPDVVSFSSSDGSNPQVNLDRGDWTFYGVGYAGTAYVVGGTTYYKKLTGAISCGTSTVSIRGGQSTNISLNLSSEGCSGKLARTLKFHTTQVDRCDAFYNYDGNVDSFNAAATYSAGTTCIGLPGDQQAITTYPYYKVSVLNIAGGSKSEGVTSTCRLYNFAADRLVLPIGKVPFQIKLYRTLAQCEANIVHNSFDLSSGIETGNPLEFDQAIVEIAADSSDTRIVLPTAHTKRWKSPFMSMIPRLLCDTGLNCFTSPTPVTPDPNPMPSTYSGYIEWNSPKKNQLIIPDVVTNSCSGLTHDSKYFGLKDCEIKNGFLYTTAVRNELLCRPSLAVGITYYDIYERNGFIYLLYSNGSNSVVRILDDEGQTITTLTLPTNTYRAVAATDAGEIFVASRFDGTQSYIKNSSGSYVQSFNDAWLLTNKIELTPDGKMLFYVPDSDGTMVNSYNVVQRIDKGQIGFPKLVQKIQYYPREEVIYTLNVNVQNDPAEIGGFNATPVNDAGDFSSVIPQFSTAKAISFHINSDILYSYGIGDGPGNVVTATKIAGVWTTLNGLSGLSFLSLVADKFIAVSRGVYAVDSGTSTLVSNKFKFNGEWDPPTATGSCIDSFTVRLGSQTTTMNFATFETPINATKNLNLFGAAFEMVGIKDIPVSHSSHRYLFDSINKNQVRGNSSGRLGNVQRLLGPQGIGGMLYEYSSCEQIRDLLLVSNEINKTFAVDDPYSGYRSYQIRLSKNNSVIPAFTCDNNVINQAGCVTPYDMLISVTSTGLFEKENYNMKLKCGSKAGEIDYFKYNGTESKKELHYWNTTVEAHARSDSYELLQSSNYFNSQMSYIVKSSDDSIRSRTVVLEKWDDLIRTYTSDYERDAIDHRVQSYYVAETPAAFPLSANYATWRAVSQFSGVANVCRPVTQTSINGATTTCNMNALSNNNSKGLPLSMATLENSDISGTAFQNLFQTPP